MFVGVGYSHTVEIDRADLRNHDASFRGDCLTEMVFRSAPYIDYYFVAGAETVVLWSC